MLQYQAAIFDLDGVIVDTAKYHFLAWKRLADKLGINFTEKDNERLKGVNRIKCLDIILEIGGMSINSEDKKQLAEKKNSWYREYIEKMDRSGLLEGAEEYIQKVKAMGVLTAIGSASKNAGIILARTGINDIFDVVVDGNMVESAKPDPEVFLKAAEMLGVLPLRCVVFEDSTAGITAAKSIGMTTVGIGRREILSEADVVFPGLHVADTAFFRNE